MTCSYIVRDVSHDFFKTWIAVIRSFSKDGELSDGGICLNGTVVLHGVASFIGKWIKRELHFIGRLHSLSCWCANLSREANSDEEVIYSICVLFILDVEFLMNLLVVWFFVLMVVVQIAKSLNWIVCMAGFEREREISCEKKKIRARLCSRETQKDILIWLPNRVFSFYVRFLP